ncbi:uncharacterized protein LOC132611633 [Lycium barbarum]|uniref:uncharacterized protein LOC132611633 n=1 Tax=Lycium barbarum TaxID=112863 RepID=UPI00293EEAE6|nr:uncharacterized protein LOC132611633 [Lycium barbarum]
MARVNSIARSWSSSQSQSWKEPLNCRATAEPHMLWKINSGSSFFWWDSWTGLGPLAVFLQKGTMPGNTLVNEFIHENKRDTEKLLNTVPAPLHNLIERIHINDPSKPDTCIWTINSDGKFTCASPRELTRKRKDTNDTLNNLWYKRLPFKIAFLNWRVMRKKLPLDDIVSKFGQNIVSRCNCCPNPQSETLDHLFVHGDIAKNIWQYFANSLGIKISNINLHLSWRDICVIVDNYRNQISSCLMYWDRPITQQFKINTDGSSLIQMKKAGAGGIRRNKEGRMILAYSEYLEFCSNNRAEIEAALIGLKYSSSLGLNNIIFEMDSKLMVV